MMKPPKDTLPPNTQRRDKWNAVPPKVINFGIDHPVHHILIDNTGTDHCTTTEDCTRIIKDLQTEHMNQGLPDIKQNFIIGGDGNIYVARGWVSEATLPDEYKEKTNDMIYFSYFGPKGRQPTEEELKTFNQMIYIGQLNEFIVKEPVIYQHL